MHNYVANSGRKALLISFFIIFFIFLFNPVSAYASAAEKWEYDVVPDQNQKLQVTGHKVDQYGNAANDYQYKTKIDPKTAVNRTKMGTVGMNRLLKVTGWGILGNAALQALLEAVDWVIDPAAQSIWRNKKPSDSMNCSYTYNEGGKTYFYKFKGATDLFLCPLEAAKSIVQEEAVSNQYAVKNSGKFERWTLFNVDLQFKFEYSYQFKPEIQNGKTVYFETSLAVVKTKIEAPTPAREYLSPEQLADYANHTHPDYSKPDLAPKLEPKYNPQIAPDLWKPANPWEYDNSPTVDEVKKELEQEQPEPKDDKIKENEPDPETGGKSFSLPAFCSWAVTVCEFIDWTKKNDELEEEEPQLPQQIDIGQLKTDTFKATPGCPAPMPINITIGTRGTTHISYEPICQFAEKWSFIAPLIGFLSGAMIIVGVGRKGEDSEI